MPPWSSRTLCDSRGAPGMLSSSRPVGSPSTPRTSSSRTSPSPSLEWELSLSPTFSFSVQSCTTGPTRSVASKPPTSNLMCGLNSHHALRILTHLRQVAGSHTKLLVVDNLLPYACVDESSDISGGGSDSAVRSLAPEGSPLLPNLGRASANGYLLDISVSHIDAPRCVWANGGPIRCWES